MGCAAIAVPFDPVLELIENAAGFLAWNGYLDPEDEDIPPEVLADLSALADEGPCGACPHWPSGSALADHFLARMQDEYERSLPTWACNCGRVHKVIHSAAFPGDQYFDAAEDGMLGDLIGAVRVNSKGQRKGDATCRGCGRAIADTITDQTRPQQALF